MRIFFPSGLRIPVGKRWGLSGSCRAPRDLLSKEQFDGVISGVTEWGLYVELNENKCEGMIPMRDLGDDYYDFDEKNYCLTGRRHHKKFSLGDPVTIKVARANLEKKQLDFALVEK